MILEKVSQLRSIWRREGAVNSIWAVLGFLLFSDARYRYQRRIERIGYSDANKYKLIKIDPNSIKYENRTLMQDSLDELNTVVAGNWDKATRLFNERIPVRAVMDHFSEGKPWTQTLYHKNNINRANNGGYYGHTSEKELFKLYKRWEKLYGKIQSEGYKSQTEISDTRGTDDYPDEITVNIGRNGEIIWQGQGQHRLAMAKVIGINEVVALVTARHAQWQDIRNEIRKTDTLDELDADLHGYVDHPDLQDIIPNKNRSI